MRLWRRNHYLLQNLRRIVCAYFCHAKILKRDHQQICKRDRRRGERGEGRGERGEGKGERGEEGAARGILPFLQKFDFCKPILGKRSTSA